MSAAEFEAYRSRAILEYAAAHVAAGDWSADQAERLATEQTESLLPEGVDTPGMLLLTAESARDGIVGIVWVALEHSEKRGAWIYDIEIVPAQRRKGYGRALLQALEQLASQHGVVSIGLNVFADNTVARRLYESSDYQATSLHMRKTLE
jgi:ribosomal protein S18 acetylase RimI-like enzyme